MHGKGGFSGSSGQMVSFTRSTQFLQESNRNTLDFSQTFFQHTQKRRFLRTHLSLKLLVRTNSATRVFWNFNWSQKFKICSFALMQCVRCQKPHDFLISSNTFLRLQAYVTEPDFSDMNKTRQVSRLFLWIIVNKESYYPFRMTVLIALFVLWISLIRWQCVSLYKRDKKVL